MCVAVRVAVCVAKYITFYDIVSHASYYITLLHTPQHTQEKLARDRELAIHEHENECGGTPLESDWSVFYFGLAGLFFSILFRASSCLLYSISG